MIPIRKVLSLSILLLLTLGAAQAATWKRIDVPGAIQTEIHGINNAGEMVGGYGDASSSYGFLFSGGIFTKIEPPGSIASEAYGVNDFRHVVGYFLASDFTYHGFLFDGQNFTVLDFPGASETDAYGINNAGEIFGSYVGGDPYGKHGFKWSNGNFAQIDVPGSLDTLVLGTNNRGDIVGSYLVNSTWHGFVQHANGALRDLGIFHLPWGINDHKIVVGFGSDSTFYGFRLNLKTKTFVRMNFRHRGTFCFGTNDQGQIVGSFQGRHYLSHGLLWTK